MLHLNKLVLILPLSASLLFGCSSGEDLYAPAEVPVVTNRFAPTELWSDGVGGVGKFYSELSPAFASGTIYAAGRDGDVYAIVSATGKKIWHVDLDDEDENDGRRSARLSGGVSAYAGKTAVGSENGYIYVLNSIDGTLLWKAYVGAEVISKPAFSLSADKIFVFDSQGRLSAYNLADGSKLWVSGSGTSGLRLRAQGDPVVIGDDYVIIGESSGRVSVISQQNGAIVNQIVVSQSSGSNVLQRMRDISSTPLLLGDTMYVTSYRGGFASYSFSSQSFESRLAYNSAAAPAIDADSIVIVEDNDSIVCVNRADNSERWTLNSLTYRNLTEPVIYGDYVVVGDFEGYIYFINLATGVIEYLDELDSSGFYHAPLLADGNLYVQSRDGDLYCLNYDPSGSARVKEFALNQLRDYAGLRASFALPGVGATGIYAPDDISYEQLMARRQAILRMAAQVEAQQRAAEAERRAYEQRRAEYVARMEAIQQAERERLAGFGIMSGVRSDSGEGDEQPAAQAPAQEETVTPPPAADLPTQEDYNEKAEGFGI